MCCKCCQSCLESIYWHCFEKHFCYDESIALYEEEEEKNQEKKSEEKNNNAFDNLAFYDNVALIANRAIFSIEPIPAKPDTVITQQPRRPLRWFETDTEDSRKIALQIPKIETECDTKKEASDEVPERKYRPRKQPSVTMPSISQLERNISTSLQDIGRNSVSLETINEEGVDKLSTSTLSLPPPVKIRKKSLHERRVSKSLTLNIDRLDIPMIRQVSFPKFYLDTPEYNQTDATIAPTPIQAFETPRLSNIHFKFDLRSVVQLEMERSKLRSTPSQKENRLSLIKEKLRILRSSSSSNLHGNG